MSWCRILGAVLVLMLPTIGWAQETLDTLGDPEKGKFVYAKICIFCHGPLGDGNGLLSKSLPMKPRDFTDWSFWQRRKRDARYLVKLVRQGGARTLRPQSDMPAFGALLTEAEIKDVLAYEKTFRGPEPPTVVSPPEAAPAWEHLPATEERQELIASIRGKMWEVLRKPSFRWTLDQVDRLGDLSLFLARRGEEKGEWVLVMDESRGGDTVVFSAAVSQQRDALAEQMAREVARYVTR